jgi:hypothetical protein
MHINKFDFVRGCLVVCSLAVLSFRLQVCARGMQCEERLQAKPFINTEIFSPQIDVRLRF